MYDRVYGIVFRGEVIKTGLREEEIENIVSENSIFRRYFYVLTGFVLMNLLFNLMLCLEKIIYFVKK